MKYKLQPYNLQELGQRQNQEDSLFPALSKSTVNDRLFILCDGMGGHEKGEVASATVCEAMSDTILSRWNPNEPLSDELLLQALENAYDALDVKDNGEERKMGTTMTFLCFHAEGVTVAHIGDSRVYQLRPKGYVRKGFKKEKWPAQIMFKTRDHSLVNDLIDVGEITEEEAKVHPQKNVITRAMQPCQERRAKATIAHLTDVREGDYFYMCSDGMLEQTSDENLLFIVTNPKSTNEEKIEMLRNVTDENKDNHTAHLIQVTKVEVQPVIAVTTKNSLSHPQTHRCTWIFPKTEEPMEKNYLAVVFVFVVVSCIVLAVGFLFTPSSDVKGQESVGEQAECITHKQRVDNIEGLQTKKDRKLTETNTEQKEKISDSSVNKDSVKENPAQEGSRTEVPSKILNKLKKRPK